MAVGFAMLVGSICSLCAGSVGVRCEGSDCRGAGTAAILEILGWRARGCFEQPFCFVGQGGIACASASGSCAKKREAATPQLVVYDEAGFAYMIECSEVEALLASEIERAHDDIIELQQKNAEMRDLITLLADLVYSHIEDMHY